MVSPFDRVAADEIHQILTLTGMTGLCVVLPRVSKEMKAHAAAALCSMEHIEISAYDSVWHSSMIARVDKPIYGIQQAGRRLQRKLFDWLRAKGFQALDDSDPCVFKLTCVSGEILTIGVPSLRPGTHTMAAAVAVAAAAAAALAAANNRASSLRATRTAASPTGSRAWHPAPRASKTTSTAIAQSG